MSTSEINGVSAQGCVGTPFQKGTKMNTNENMNNNEVLDIIEEMTATTAGVAGKIVGTVLKEAVDIPIRFTAGVVKSGAVSQTGRLGVAAFGFIKKGVTSDLSKRALSGGKTALTGIADKVISKSPLLVEFEEAVKSDVTRIKESIVSTPSEQ